MLSAKPLVIQKTEDVSDSTVKSSSSAWDYSASASLLHGARVPFSVSAVSSQASGFSDSDLGSETEFYNEQRNVNINLKNTWFPSHIFYSSNYHDLLTTSTLSGVDWKNEYEVERRGFTGRSSKLGLSVESTDYTDLVNMARQYTTERGWLSHQAVWGKGSYLNSYIDSVEQTGFGAYSRDIVTENLHLQHYSNFATDMRYNYNKSVHTGSTTIRQGQVDFLYKLYGNLDTQIGYQRKTTEFDLGDEVTTGPRFSVVYTKRLPWENSTFSLGVNGSELETDRRAQSQLVGIIDESHVTDITGIVTLNQPFVNAASVVVTNTLGIPYTPGVHYNVVTIANITEIQIIDTIVIPTGTSILVDYDYLTPPEMQFISTQTGGNFSLMIRNFRLHYQYVESEQELLTSAGSNFLYDHRDETAGVNYNLGYRNLQAGVGYQYRKSEIGDYLSESRKWNQTLKIRLTSYIYISESLNTGTTETSQSEVDSSGAKVNATFKVPGVAVKIGSHIDYWRRDDSLGNDDDFLSHGMKVDWRYHLIQVSAGLRFSEWSGTSRNSDETRFMLTFSRNSR